MLLCSEECVAAYALTSMVKRHKVKIVDSRSNDAKKLEMNTKIKALKTGEILVIEGYKIQVFEKDSGLFYIIEKDGVMNQYINDVNRLVKVLFGELGL